MDARCHCGAVRFKTPLPAPLATYVCHCDTCKALTSSAFAMSAIFPKFEPPASELLSCYRGGCVSGIDWSKAVHIWTKSAMVPIPESSESYSERSSDSSGQGPAQDALD
ncbi:hypothetical protein MY10362_006590 [Beauveria mimosiformis]|uniref:Glutathione-dependent formaldehyde-activating enzyme n=1 Tax=Beauveria bassiana (strain ARSEF 2860) TaxID=655819 RepID=J4WIB5_BEAB2|nr:glutathione-dependent formaldehyde-activating enzyme [Beauveria bassiana ARSEF 2860]EJP69590.1 glutathione-dependent formaldehyde-activating enzyme [Beauveria bassiana ARSEF 2860]